LLVAIYSSGSIVVIWDGRKHIHINLTINYNDGDSTTAEIHTNKFEAMIIEQLPSLKRTLRDEQLMVYRLMFSFLKDISDDD